ncbi:MAG: hypothetical protein AB7F59_04685 [Bdellovibrionales bacterium]
MTLRLSFILFLSVIFLNGCSMNRCKTIVDPNPPAAAVEDTSEKTEAAAKNSPWATPSHNPSMTQLPGQVSSSTALPPPADTKAVATPVTSTLGQPIAVPDVESSDKNGPTVRIFKYDGSRQCGQGKPQTLEIMARDLKGITILSQENKNDGMMRIQMCGAPTGNANIYEIYQKDMKKAFKKGFREWKAEGQ